MTADPTRGALVAPRKARNSFNLPSATEGVNFRLRRKEGGTCGGEYFAESEVMGTCGGEYFAESEVMNRTSGGFP